MPDFTEMLSLLSFSIREAPGFTFSCEIFQAFTQGSYWPVQAPLWACAPAKGEIFRGCAQGNPLDPRMAAKVKSRRPRGFSSLLSQQGDIEEEKCECTECLLVEMDG